MKRDLKKKNANIILYLLLNLTDQILTFSQYSQGGSGFPFI